MKIVFMGTPEFAVASLKILLENGYPIVGVVTAPDKPGGRLGVMQSAVKQFAVANGLHVLQPVKLRDPEFLASLKALNADLQVVVAFRMLPEMVWNMPPLGTINLHGSLLPKYRGAAPINWAVINGEKETGVTTFRLTHEIDTGDVFFQERVPIGPEQTAGELHDEMMEVGAQLILKTVKAIESGEKPHFIQQNADATYAPKIFSENCKINFEKSAEELHNFVRGLSPYPGAWTLLDGKILKIYRVRAQQFASSTTPRVISGQLISDGKTCLRFGCRDGLIDVLELQLEGKRKMNVSEFLNGFGRYLASNSK